MFLWEKKLLKKDKFKFIAGVDEAGRGPLAGPLVVAAVILTPEYRESYFAGKISYRIADSKQLSSKERERVFAEIVKNSWIGIGIANVEVIDSLDLVSAIHFAAELALENLRKKPEHILTDAGIHISSYPSLSLANGERKSLSIASASVVAKVVRDRIMSVYDYFFPQHAFHKHKGYGTKFHLNLLKEYGPSPIHRRSFSPLKDWFKG